MKTTSPCPVCRETVNDMTKRWDPTHGFCCPECQEFMQSADSRLRRYGIEGVIVDPVRFPANPEKP